MASDVTIRCRPHDHIAFPSLCCYCLEPATTTHAMLVRVRNMRTDAHTKLSFAFPVKVPYCETHKQQTELFSRYRLIAIITLSAIAIVLAIILDIMFSRILQVNGLMLWCVNILSWVLLGAGGVGVYQLGRKLLQRRHPTLADYSYSGGLGVTPSLKVVYPQGVPHEPQLSLTFTFRNNDFARYMAALHNTEARAIN